MNQKPNARGFVDRFSKAPLTQTSGQSNNLISKKEDQINKTQDSQKKVLKKKKPRYLREEFVNDRPVPMFPVNKRNPT